ncbi:hypothetical protein CLOBY_08450 [Clostridium saccharobutylicum]|uniref:hypothetical protein n=1 Tax=Clostridium saccharobutylicum TaxID=169679 RepID=UPI000983F2EC|nr:hypothetical protein [Clostridium saccharobutylicum]AQS08735.1 hypothetical protein CLOBY_08450 [Clostridium saccharobutylicum]MBC2438749.1 hypothetical protein [Clostridium saccharobutylicum]NSB91035.1 hypothetical protein [Clostridium saccharobutylicum]NYC28920.1 hypothetical protein [Clostridium saccharobutylicum]OOM18389.1 hypothetical protein CLSAB_07500 [Clostridium saccharobutylicum]
MKFFTKELWDKVNSATDENQLEVEKEWNENCRLYKKQFDELKKMLPDQFLDKYSICGDFHDFSIIGIEIIKSKSKVIPFVDFKIDVANGDEKYAIYYMGISNITINGNFESKEIEYLANKKGVIDSWGYDEFQISDDNLLVHEILFLSGSSMKVQFKDISILDKT